MSTSPTTSDQQPSASTTIGELRQKYGAHFAKSYGDQDTWGEVSGRAGVTTIEEYIQQGKQL